MKVVAIQTGYHDHMRRREGDVFSIPDAPRRKPSPKEMQYLGEGMKPAMDKDGTIPQVYSAKWMRPVSANTPERKSTAQLAINKRHDEIRSGNAATGPMNDGVSAEQMRAAPGEFTGNADVI